MRNFMFGSIFVVVVCFSSTSFAGENLFQVDPEYQFEYWQRIDDGHVLDADYLSGMAISQSAGFNYILESLVPVKSDGAKGRSARIGVFLFAALLNGEALFAAHEFGHFRADSMVGMTEPTFLPIDDESGKSYPGNWYTAFRLFFDKAMGEGDYGAGQSDKEHNEFVSSARGSYYHRRQMLLAYGMGINTEQLVAERLYHRALMGTANPLNSVLYLFGQASSFKYPQEDGFVDVANDVHNYRVELSGLRRIESFENRNEQETYERYKTSEKIIRYHSQIPKLFSGGVISYGWALYNYLAHGKRHVVPIYWNVTENFRLFWPEYNTYLTTEGPTGRISLPMSLFEVQIIPTYETNVPWLEEGPFRNELGLMLRTRILYDILQISGYVAMNVETSGVWLEGEILVTPLKWLEFGVAGSWAKKFTFRREIRGTTTAFWQKRDGSMKAFVRARVDF